MRVSVLDVQHKKPLTAGRPRFFGKLSHASRGVPCPRAKYGNYRRGEIRRPGPCCHRPIQTDSLAQNEAGLHNRLKARVPADRCGLAALDSRFRVGLSGGTGVGCDIAALLQSKVRRLWVRC